MQSAASSPTPLDGGQNGNATPGGIGNATGGFNVNGMRNQSNNFLLDGAPNNDSFNTGFVLRPPPDAIQEFKILTHAYEAEFGRNAGSVVNVVTRSGSNTWSGVLWEFNRDVFDDVTCATLADGATVEVEGTKQADGSILARKVEGEAGPDEVEGMIFALAGTGSCPALTFKVGSTLATATAVNTNSSTTFNGVACTALADGARIEVEGTKQADGSITAASVELH